jgi:hypothetical protein|tara:strand:+ start:90 stop:461 length:372 start_codon:yes stop_codon:yes gene_type:complete
VKPEQKLYQKLKKNTPNILWSRLETWVTFGLPDLIGYHNSSGFFMVELKIQTGNKIRFSPHQILFHTIRTNRNFIVVEQARPGGLKDIKLYGSKSINDLINDPRAVDPLAVNDFEKIQKILIS